MKTEQRFSARLEEATRGGAFVTVPQEVVQRLGGGGRVAVRAKFNGVGYRGSVVRMGGRSVLGVTKAIRRELGKVIGDELVVTVERDEDERQLMVPEDLTRELSNRPAARGVFEALSYSHRREYVQWIEAAKRPETRERRIRDAMDRLGQKP